MIKTHDFTGFHMPGDRKHNMYNMYAGIVLEYF